MPNTEAETIPWDRLLVDILRPYKIRKEFYDDPLILKALTMIEPSAGWFEIVLYNDKQADTIANLV